MSPPPLSLQDKVVQAIIVWPFMALISIPLCEAASVLPYCLSTPPGLAHIHTCLPALTILMIFENWMVANPQIGTTATHYWSVPLTASVFTVFFLRWWWHS